jgi:hypothetical protein
MTDRIVANCLWAALVCLVSTVGSSAVDAAPLAVSGSPDITIDQSGTILRPGDVSEDVEVVLPTKIDLGPLPDGADVTAYSPASATAQYFAVGHTLLLPGGVTARPRDVVQWDGAAYSIALDGASVGLPDGVRIDAFAYDPLTGDVWFSFDTTFDLAGAVLRPSDVVDGLTLALVFDSTAAGVPAGMDVDGVSPVPGTSDVLLSFDVGGTLGGITFADEDVMRYDTVNDAWTLAIDASASDADWAAADLDALHVVPEPGSLPMLVCGLGLMVAASRRRLIPRRWPRYARGSGGAGAGRGGA